MTKYIKSLKFFVPLILVSCATNEGTEPILRNRHDADFQQIRFVATPAASALTRAEVDIQPNVFDADEVLQGYVWYEDYPVDADDHNSWSPKMTAMAPENNQNDLVLNQSLNWPADPEKKIRFYGLYPENVTKDVTSFTVEADQTTDEKYKLSDLMWAGDHTNNTYLSAQYDDTNAAQNMPFKHKMAKLIVNAVSDGSISGFVINGITVKDVKRQIGFTPTTGVLGDDGTLNDEGDILMSNNGACLLPPQTIAADAEFIEIAVTIGGNPYTAKYKAATAMPMVEGHQYTLDLMIGSQSLTLTSSITDWSDENATHTITPKQWGSLVMDAVSGTFTYAKDGLGNPVPHQPMPAVKSVDGTTLTNGTEFDYSWFANTNAGTALVVATGKSGTDYVGQVALQKFTIDKATPVVTAPTALSLTYNGTSTSTASDQTLANIGSTDGGQLVYSTSEDGTYSDVIPTGKNAGSYDVWYKVVGDANYNDVAPAKLECAIAKKEIANGEWSIAPASLALKTGSGTPHTGDININYGTTYDETGIGTISWVSSDATKAPVSDGTVTGEAVGSAIITVSIPNATNYAFAGNHTCTVTVTTDDPGVCLAQSEFGYIVAANGKAYKPADKQWVQDNSSIVGMVACKNGSSGIVLAKSNNSSKVTWANRDSNMPSAVSVYVNDLSSKTQKTWTCGTSAEYQSALSGTWTTTSPTKDTIYNASTINSKLEAAGCDQLGSVVYWSGTAKGSSAAMSFNIGYWDDYGKTNPYSVRPLFAF